MDNLADFLTADLYKGGQMCEADGLAAVLVAGHLGYDLGGNIAGSGKAMGTLNEGAGDDSTVLQHILQVHQVTVVHMLGVIIAVVEVDDALPMGLNNLLRQQNTFAEVAADLTGHVVPLGGVDHWVFIGILLLGLLVIALDKGENLIVGCVGFADQGTGIAVGDVMLGHFKGAVGHDVMLHHVLNFLHSGSAADLLALELYRLGDALDLHGGHAIHFLHGVVGLGDGNDDLRDVKGYLGAVALDDLHFICPPPPQRGQVIFITCVYTPMLHYILCHYKGLTHKI